MIEIINVYSNMAMPDSDLIGRHGQSFFIKVGNDRILMDTGADGPTLLHNMTLLGIDPNNITHLVLSHGHYDHTWGLPDLLNARTSANPLPVIAHPLVREEKRLKILFINKSKGFPKLTEAQEKSIKLIYSKEPYAISPRVKTTGEIAERIDRDGIEPVMKHLVNGKYEVDPVLDDISVLIDTSKGQIVLTGCAHAGIINILRKAKKLSDKPILAILGGTHMVRYSKEEVIRTGEKFRDDFDDPDLYLNHCTDKLPSKLLKMTKTIDILKENFGEERIKTCYVGTKVTFEE
ncbi:MAG: MBL fold metallo-hydrolase [Candidatus Lokiarchaeota archaeon]|nr:MBL fold metallo-hydrolase [Candidatus Lokiarchaeota archaeon]